MADVLLPSTLVVASLNSETLPGAKIGVLELTHNASNVKVSCLEDRLCYAKLLVRKSSSLLQEINCNKVTSNASFSYSQDLVIAAQGHSWITEAQLWPYIKSSSIFVGWKRT